MRTSVVVLAALVMALPVFQVDDGGSPPITIIEIPASDDAPSPGEPSPVDTVPPGESDTSSPVPVPPTTAATVAPTPFTPPTEAVPTTLTPPTAGAPENPGAWPGWAGPVPAGVVLAGMTVALGLLLYRLTHQTMLGPSRSSRNPRGAGSMGPWGGRYEAVQFVSRVAHIGPAVTEHKIGEFDSMEAAIEAARSAREAFSPSIYEPDAWWVVRKPGNLRAEWVAESGSPQERVIDLRSDRLAERALRQRDLAERQRRQREFAERGRRRRDH